MARGFSAAPGASADFVEATSVALERPRMLELGMSKNGLVRAAIAERDDCPFGLMVTLAHDYSANVRCAVAANPRAQRSVLQYLAADRAAPVALALVGNPSLPRDLLEELALHKRSDVRVAANLRLDSGVPCATDAHAEDEHTPELAEHGSLALDVEWSLGGDVWSRPTEDFTPQPVVDHALMQMVAEAILPPEAAPSQAEAVSLPQGEGSPGSTRIAPVRGFRAPQG